MTTPRPQAHGTAETIEKLRQHLIKEAAEAHAQYSQYNGFWDTWRVVEVVKPVRTKLGQAFQVGDIVLRSPEVRTEKAPPRGRAAAGTPYEEWPEKQFVTCYSFRNQCNTGLRPSDIREVQIVEPVA